MDTQDNSKDKNSTKLQTWDKGKYELPLEIQHAPPEIQESYVEWLKMDDFITNHPDRFYTYTSLITNELETSDMRGIPGRAQQLAKEKGASPEDIKQIDNLMAMFTGFKTQKLRLGTKWRNWLKTQGSSMFDWKKAELIEMFGRYMTNDEVKERLEKDGYDVSNLELVKFVANNKAAINKKKLEFVNTTKDHFLAMDAGRMESLAMLHGKFLKMFNALYNTPNKSAAQRAELKSISAELRALIEQARKELKGEEVKLTVDGRIDITASLQAQKSIHELSKSIPMHILPIYLVAAKTNTNPHYILSSLVNSFYRNFNGFGNIDPNNKPPTTIDLIRNYDWNEIQLHHDNKKNNPQAIETITEWEEIPFTQQGKIQTKREKLLLLIKEAQNKGNADNE